MRNKKKIAALATGALVLGSAGVAYAYWTTTGSGTGSGSTTAGAATLTLTQNPNEAGEATALDAMYPGDEPQPLVVRVTNSSDTDSFLVSTVSAWVSTDKTGCNADDFRINGGEAGDETSPSALTWAPVELAAGASDDTVGDTIQFNNKGTEQNACKGATVTVHYLAS